MSETFVRKLFFPLCNVAVSVFLRLLFTTCKPNFRSRCNNITVDMGVYSPLDTVAVCSQFSLQYILSTPTLQLLIRRTYKAMGNACSNYILRTVQFASNLVLTVRKRSSLLYDTNSMSDNKGSKKVVL